MLRLRGSLPRYGMAAAALALVAALWLLSSSGSQGPRAGETAPELSLADLSGRTVTLAQLRGKVVLLDFWATWCSSCIEELPKLKTLSDRLADKEFVMLGVSVDESPEAVSSFAAKESLPYRILFALPEAANAYGIWSLPTKYLIDARGRVARKYSGEADFKEIESDIIRLLQRRDS